MPYSKLSTSISEYMARELKFDEEKKAIIAYSLDSLFLYLIGYAVVIAIGWLIGITTATFFALITGDVLRKLSGGAHFSTPYRCLLFSAAAYPAVSWASVRAFSLWGREPLSWAYMLFICFACLVIVFVFAPVDSAAKPIVSDKFRKKLKRLSIIALMGFSVGVFLLKNTYIAYSITAGMTLQSLTLLPFFQHKA
ncbi:MAG: accessory gene regulator B family protein [Peptococcaceae bacterium]|jgi:accessory gene regulator B|nr:accessory gene regulator B family protein [Peptococcaceae bacterium]MDH7525887.1 accessory gene regulator B family protein [Peptococcaceae bacterium]